MVENRALAGIAGGVHSCGGNNSSATQAKLSTYLLDMSCGVGGQDQQDAALRSPVLEHSLLQPALHQSSHSQQPQRTVSMPLSERVLNGHVLCQSLCGVLCESEAINLCANACLKLESTAAALVELAVLLLVLWQESGQGSNE